MNVVMSNPTRVEAGTSGNPSGGMAHLHITNGPGDEIALYFHAATVTEAASAMFTFAADLLEEAAKIMSELGGHR